MLKILIQGELGSFHHQAAEQLFGSDIEIVPCATFSQLFNGIDENSVGLSAIENSLYGSINEVYDLLEKSGAQIFAETELVIHQNLIGLPGAEKSKIKEIYSHPVALAQCENYLEKHFPSAEKIEFEDTAAAVRHIAELGDPTKAAIAGVQTLKLFDVKPLAENIEDNSVNFTRFVAVKKPGCRPELASCCSPESEFCHPESISCHPEFAEKSRGEAGHSEPVEESRSTACHSEPAEESTKTTASSKLEILPSDELATDLPVVGKSSLILTTGHQPGALYEALGLFVAHQLNLTKLQSRPIIGKKWRYKFYIDFLGDAAAAQQIAEDLRAAGNEVYLLGSY